MPYDEELAERIRDLLADEPNLVEKKMFGGLLVRVDPEESDALVETTPAYPMEMRGRTMRGWLRVDTDDVRTKRELSKWVGRGAAYARSLPPKR